MAGICWPSTSCVSLLVFRHPSACGAVLHKSVLEQIKLRWLSQMVYLDLTWIAILGVSVIAYCIREEYGYTYNEHDHM